MTIVWTGGPNDDEPKEPTARERTAIALIVAWLVVALAFYLACWR